MHTTIKVTIERLQKTLSFIEKSGCYSIDEINTAQQTLLALKKIEVEKIHTIHMELCFQQISIICVTTENERHEATFHANKLKFIGNREGHIYSYDKI
jgi:hypothetical protein